MLAEAIAHLPHLYRKSSVKNGSQLYMPQKKWIGCSNFDIPHEHKKNSARKVTTVEVLLLISSTLISIKLEILFSVIGKTYLNADLRFLATQFCHFASTAIYTVLLHFMLKTFLYFFTLDIGRIILTLEGRLHLLKYIFSFGQKPTFRCFRTWTHKCCMKFKSARNVLLVETTCLIIYWNLK